MSLAETLRVEVATGTDKEVSDAPAVVSVITAEDIAAIGARSLSEALEHIPGLHVAPSINRLSPMFSIRGIFTDSTPQVLVLIDGVDMSEMTALSTPYAFYYPTHFIERIEIIRGPGSAVYGADAFSGVINIITKQPEGNNSATANLRLGSFDTQEAWINASFISGKFKGTMSISHKEHGSDNDRITPYGVMKRDGDVSNLHLNVDYGNFSFKNWYWKTNQYMGVGAGIIGNDLDLDRSRSWRSQLSWQGELSEHWSGSTDFSYGSSDYDGYFQLFPPGVWPVGNDGNLFIPPFTPINFPDGVIGNPLAATERSRLNASAIYSGQENHRVRIGLGFERSKLTDVKEFKNFGPGIIDIDNLPADGISQALIDVSGTPFAYTPEYDRDLWYVSVQDEWQISSQLALTTGVRFDHYSDFGSTTNPRVALVWNVSQTLTSKFLFGTAFRAPRVSELAFINNPTVLGNPNLEPEEIRTAEIALDYRPSSTFNSQLNVFSYQSENLIQLDSAFTFENRGEQDGIGFELETNWQLSDQLQTRASLSWLDSELPLTGEDKERVPGLMAYLDFRYQFSSQLLVSMQHYWITDRKRQAGDLRPEVDDYLQSDLNLLWRASEQWEIQLGVKNIFDDNIVEPVPNSALFALGLGFPDDYPMQSRQVFGSVSYQF